MLCHFYCVMFNTQLLKILTLLKSFRHFPLKAENRLGVSGPFLAILFLVLVAGFVYFYQIVIYSELASTDKIWKLRLEEELKILQRVKDDSYREKLE